MKIAIRNSLLLIPQLVLSFVYGMILYMVFAFMDYQGGFEELIGMALFQPLMGSILTTLSLLVCFLVGLPLRYNAKIHVFWVKQRLVQFSLFTFGFCLIVLAHISNFSHIVEYDPDGVLINKEVPNLSMLGLGWFITLFILLHMFPPLRWSEFVERKLGFNL